jgi:hypothetical protein
VKPEATRFWLVQLAFGDALAEVVALVVPDGVGVGVGIIEVW